jgi:DNA-damage-inducible protein D
MITIATGTVKETKREIENIHLSRFACYLIIQNADPTKESVALGQRYFAIQTRRQEQSDQMLEDGKRKHLRDEISRHNTALAITADKA